MLRSAIGAPLAAAARCRLPVAALAPVRSFAAAPGDNSSETPGGMQANPFAMFEQAAKDAQVGLQQAAQRLNEAAAGGPSAAPLLQEIQSMAHANVAQMSSHIVPMFTAMLILVRSSPGQPLTAAQQEILEKVLPIAALGDVAKGIVQVLPEDPQVVQLRAIAEKLEAIGAKLEALQALEKKSE
mmetsp:Transcript_28836/g.73159  ORF Transcript_28836/g.73159 Transcript_28836/m.73159 type:complete len:184 (-) Transcript_28836:58-609(-)